MDAAAGRVGRAGGEGQRWGRFLGCAGGFCPFSPGSIHEKGLKSTSLVLPGSGEEGRATK